VRIFLITAGATREPIDPVRFISNRSSGRMGFALASAARDRGAEVTIVAGITSVDPPGGVRVVRVSSAKKCEGRLTMKRARPRSSWPRQQYLIIEPKEKATTKIKKSEAELELKLERTADILGEVAQGRTNGQLLIGFAAETDNLLKHARAKLAAKAWMR